MRNLIPNPNQFNMLKGNIPLDAFWLFFILIGSFSLQAGRDLPPLTAYPETIPAGSFIIPMDNNLQGNAGLFNTKAYGLAVTMLVNDIPIKWIIKTGKQLNDADMKVASQQIFPTVASPPALPAQNFENTAPSPAWTYTKSGGGTNTTASKYNGGKSWRMGSNNSITMNNVDISDYSNVQLSVAFASALVDVGDNLIMDFSYDGGTVWTTSGTGSVSLVTPDGNDKSLNINTTTAYTVGTNPYTINIPAIASQLMVRFRSSTALAASEYYFIDDVNLTGDYSPSFYAGPMVILPADTANARTVINIFNAAIATSTQKVNVYKTNEAVEADVRYTLVENPRVAIYNDGGNANIHSDILDAANFPSSQYAVLAPETIIDSASCYTFASTPHWDVKSGYSSADNTRLTNLRYFLESGGNFFAQCEGIDAIENFPGTRYQTTTGVKTVNTAITTQAYLNSDMPVMQMQGSFLAGGGSIQNYIPLASWKSPMYFGLYFMKEVTGDAKIDTVVQLSNTKIAPADSAGGVITYLAGHSYKSDNASQVNGTRIYLNSIFIPSNRLKNKGIITSNGPTFCERDTIKLYMTPPSGGFTYKWSGPDGFTSTLKDPIISNVTAAKTGKYTCKLVTFDLCEFPVSYSIVVNVAPAVSVSVASPSICNGQGTTLSYTPAAGVSSAQWYKRVNTGVICKSKGDLLGSSSTLEVSPTSTTQYFVKVQNAFGCRDSACATVTVNPKPGFTFSSSLPACGTNTGSIVIDGFAIAPTVGTPYTAVYSPGDNIIGSGTALPNITAQPYSINNLGAGNNTVRVRSTFGCDSIFTVNVLTNPKPVPSASYSINPCPAIEGYTAQLTAADPSPNTGVWSIVNGSGSITDTNAYSTTITELSYSGVSTIVKWQVSNAFGCSDSVRSTITPMTVDPKNVSKYDTSFCLSCPIKIGDWYNFYDLNGKLLSAVNDINHDVNIGQTDFCARLTYPVAGNPGVNNVPVVPATYHVVQPYLPRYWSVNSQQEGDIAVRLFFTDEEVAALMGWSVGTIYTFNNVNALMVTAYTNSSPGFVTPGSSGGISITPTFLRVGTYWQASFTVPSSSTFFIHPVAFNGSLLPVELLNFIATPRTGSIMLDWVTASEHNSDYFDIERSLDGSSFEKIGQLEAAGYSNAPVSYQLEDSNIRQGVLYYYRLKQVDFNGDTQYSDIVTAIVGKEKAALKIGDFTPNPTTSFTSVEMITTEQTPIRIMFLDITGKVYVQGEYLLDKGVNTARFDFSMFAPGTYIGQFVTSEGAIIRRLVKLQ